MHIDTTQPPYNCVGDWDPYAGGDANATDNSAGLQQALIDVGQLWHTHMAGAQAYSGGVVVLPPGVSMIRSPLWVPDGVWIDGLSTGRSGLRLSEDFPIDQHAIWMGNKDQLASLYGGLRNFRIRSPEVQASWNTALVYSNNIQHGGFENLALEGMHRNCLRLERGYGGASYIYLRNVETLTTGSRNGYISQPAIWMNYGTTLVEGTNIVISGPGGDDLGNEHTGIYTAGGMYNFQNVHFERVYKGWIAAPSRDNDLVNISFVSGGHAVDRILHTAPNVGRTRVEMFRRNGARYSVYYNPNSLPHIDTDIGPAVWV